MKGRRAAVAKMRDAGLPEAAIAGFERRYGQLAAGDEGLLPTDGLEPVAEVPRLARLPPAPGPGALDDVAVLKLNGGLGTSMGLDAPKSLVSVRPGLAFLDVIALQVLAARRAHGARLPLVLMHSFATQEASLRHLARYPDLPADAPADFLQGREPKLRADDLGPVAWPANPRLEWCPPGHGDLYTAIATSGMLAALLGLGYRYVFVSNADNLGAVVEPRIPAWMRQEGLPFVMEVVAGTPADRKGGHIARRDGHLVVRETAQTPPDDAESFGDYERWRFYNTNNLWIDLDALAGLLAARGGDLGLPLIVNRKTVDPADASSTRVVQLETAMGAALGAIPGATALEVPRDRFSPVKTTEDLLVVRSDSFAFDPSRARLEPRAGWPLVELDPDHFRRLRDFEERFAAGVPSLVGCRRLRVIGDVRFGRGVVVTGDAVVEGPVTVPDGAVLGQAA